MVTGIPRLVLLSLLLAGAGCGSDGSGGGSSSGGTSSGGSSAGGSSSGGTSSGGTSSGGTSTGGASGSGGSAGSASGGAPGGSGGAAGGSDGGGGSSCTPTPSSVKCAAASCDTKTQECCGGPEAGKCFALTAFCGLGGGIRMECDDPSDCAAGEVCCVGEVPNAGNDAPYQTHCVKPKSFQEGGDVFGCGTTGGGFPWPRLCTCAADCNVGSCKLGSVHVPTTSASFMRCE